ncbi:hypothetical protein [Burkholderia sp. BE12]|uniref:hypothetical protein n=1 Tax=Burkholderia sp. BE12 TaxID=2082394 RepID=UPI000CF58127|nr:hypothetical protein [Burkholderia sp. BE12]
MSTFNSAGATVIKATCQGLSEPGGLNIAGLQIGDLVVAIIPGGFESGFEKVVSVAGQLQQSMDRDWSPVDFTFYLLRGV